MTEHFMTELAVPELGMPPSPASLLGPLYLNGHSVPNAESTASSLRNLLSALEKFCDEVATRPNAGSVEAPREDIQTLAKLGLLTAPLPVRLGGLGLGTEPGGHLPLLRVMTLVGGADLVLGRLLEGHINALILIANYGSEPQLRLSAHDAAQGMLFGVWNTGGSEKLRLDAKLAARPDPNGKSHADGNDGVLGAGIYGSDSYVLHGIKTFASGAPFVSRPIVTCELKDRGWQMILPRMESGPVACHIRLDPEFWKPMGMEGSESFSIDFTGAIITAEDLIGAPEDFYRDPLFRGGAIRFAAVHAGAVVRLHRLFADWLEARGRANDPYQIARLGEIALRSQASVMWVERAASVAEECLSSSADKLATERMAECANMTRVAIEEIATAVMQRVIAGVGAHGLLRPSPFEKIVRDLTMYLRQPSPDHALAEVGRASIRKSNLRLGGAENFMWREYQKDGSLPPKYFQQIYERSPDPWNFETSQYESEKYHETLKILPRRRYGSALEIGSSIGVFTHLLADRCASLLSVDVSLRALEIARTRCAGQHNVRFARFEIPSEFPAGRYDLIVLSEVGYYWSQENLHRCATLVAAHQSPGDQLVLVHLTTPVADYPLTGDQVHQSWLMRPEWRSVQQERRDRYRIDLLERVNDVGASITAN